MKSHDYNEQNPDLISTNGFQNYYKIMSSRDNIFYYENSKFLWKQLMKLDPSYIIKTKEISLLEPYVENILYSKLKPDDIDILSNEYIVQLVTLLQLIGQYMVYTQKKMEFENQELKDKIEEMEENIQNTEKYQALIENLNKQNHEKDYLLKTYQNMVNRNKTRNDINNNLSSKNDGFNGNENKYFYCKICSGKKFKSQRFLDEHMKRRHNDVLEKELDYQETNESNIKDKNYKEAFDKKLNSMREYFEKMIQQTQEIKELNLLNKKFDFLQNQIIIQNNNKINNLNQKGICRFCHHNANQISQNNINMANNQQQMANNKNILEFYNELYKLKEGFHNEMAEMNYKLDNEKKTLQLNREFNEFNEDISKIQTIKNRGYFQRNATNFNSPNKERDNEINENIKNNYNNEDEKYTNESPKVKKDAFSTERKLSIKENKKKVEFREPNFFYINNNKNKNNQNQEINNIKLEDNNEDKILIKKGDEEDINNNKQEDVDNKKDINNNNNTEVEKRIDINISLNNEEENQNVQNKLKEKNQNNEEIEEIKEMNEKNENDIYEKESKNQSAYFYNKETDKTSEKDLKEVNIKKENASKTELFLFGEKVIKRDNYFYYQNNEEYEIIEIPPKYNTDNETINNKIEKELKDKNINELIDDYANKYNKENIQGNNIFKILNIDKTIKEYRDYMENKNNNSNKVKSIQIQKNNDKKYQREFIIKSSNVLISQIQNQLSIEDNKNPYSFRNNDNNNDKNDL